MSSYYMAQPMHFYLAWLFFNILSAVQCTVIIHPNDPNLQFVGRFITTNTGDKQFDFPGCQLTIAFSNATTVDIVLSYENSPNSFWIYVDGILSDIVLDTASTNSNNTYRIAEGLTKDYHAITLFKVTEADYNNPYPKPNFVTFSGYILVNRSTFLCLHS